MSYKDQQRQLVEEIISGSLSNLSKLSVVPMQSDWSQDPKRCLSIVFFVPKDVAQPISTEVIRPLSGILPNHFFYPEDSLHLTIKNVRTLKSPPSFDDSDIEIACDAVRQVVRSHRPIRFELAELAPFSTSVSLIGYCSAALSTLIGDLDRALREAGLSDDKVYASDSIFFGNVTVCRFTRPVSKIEATSVRLWKPNRPIDLTVSNLSVAVFDSVCSRQSRLVAEKFDLG